MKQHLHNRKPLFVKHIFFFFLFAYAKINAQGDCSTAVELLNKEIVKVNRMTKGGEVNEDIFQYLCFEKADSAQMRKDKNTYWFVWECKKAGNLYFFIF